jgi:hypothetical protein
MFAHVSVLLSFVYAIAVSHILVSVTELVWARDRVRVSWLHALWMFNAMLALLTSWIGMWFLSARPNWDVAEVVITFTSAVIQYFTCSLLSIRPRDEGIIDVPAFFARQRPFIFATFAVLLLVNMFQNWWDRDLLPAPDSWLYADLTAAPLLVFVIIAGVARAMWLQWLAAIAVAVNLAYFLFSYALLGVQA